MVSLSGSGHKLSAGICFAPCKEFPHMDPAPVQRCLERDEVNPVASIYPNSLNGALSLPPVLMDFRALHRLAVLLASKGPWKFTGLKDAASDRFATNIARPPSQPSAGIF